MSHQLANQSPVDLAHLGLFRHPVRGSAHTAPLASSAKQIAQSHVMRVPLAILE